MKNNNTKHTSTSTALPAFKMQTMTPGERLNIPNIQPWLFGLFLALCALILLMNEAVAAINTNGVESPISTLIHWIPFIMEGFMMNLLISFMAMLIGTIAGGLLGLMQVSLIAPVRAGSWLVTQFFRNSPWLVLLFFIMFMLPYEVEIFGFVIPIPDWLKGTIGLSLPVMANISEIVRGAIKSIPTGQWESAESLAFTRHQTMWQIILPQCFKRMIPPWMNWYAILTMATPLCSIMGVEEAVRYAQQAMEAEGGRPELLASFYSFLLLIFFVYCYPIARWTIWLEKKYTVKN